MATVPVTFKGDHRSVDNSVNKVKGGIAGISLAAKGMGVAIKSAFAPLIAVGAALGGIAAVTNGIKGVVDLGGALDDLSAKTGASAGELLVLQTAFDLAGAGADNVANALTGLNSKLDAPTPKILNALSDLNIRFEDLQNMSMDDKFKAISSAIGGLSDKSKQAAISSTLFGRNLGQALLPLFSNKNALSDAANVVGGLAGTMDKNAAKLDKFSDALGTLKLKSQQFFGAFLGQNIDTLDKFADKLLNLDLTEFGENFGKSIKTSITDGIAAGIPILINGFIVASEIIGIAVMKAMSSDKSGWENVSLSNTLDDLELFFGILESGVGSYTGAASITIGSLLGQSLGGPALVSGGVFASGFSDRFEVAERLRNRQEERKTLAESKKIDDELSRLEKLKETLKGVNEYSVSFFGLTESILNSTNEFVKGMNDSEKAARNFLSISNDWLGLTVIGPAKARIMKPASFKELGGAIPLSDLQRVGGAKIFSTAGTNAMLEEQRKTNQTLQKIYEESKRRNNIPPNLMAVFA